MKVDSKMKYETWKNGLEAEFAVHREQNTKLIYRIKTVMKIMRIAMNG